MRSFKNTKITDYLIGLIFSMLFVSISVIITINFRPLYYIDIKFLSIEKVSGISKFDIIQNYNALMEFLSPFYNGSLAFPTLSSSPEALQHFDEVKDIFILFYYITFALLSISIPITIYKTKKRDFQYLFASSIISIVLPIVFTSMIFINFQKAFVLFHKLFFKNDNWLFDPNLDPVINILPSEYFMHCALLIILLILLFSFISFVIYKNNKRRGIQFRKNNYLNL
ncbi:MAG TPA: TIGR01906 family membrane protein [Clostridiales bacterium]|nr:TIGR01906 family membrane protein [Clostridiales bacterium]